MKMNNLKLKAMRQSLGLTVAEACEFITNAQGEPVSKRFFQYLEKGQKPIPNDVDLTFFTKASHYTALLDLLEADIEKINKDNPRPQTDNTDEYFEQLKSVKKLALPFFLKFEDFQAYTGNNSRGYWKIWQAAIGHLVLVGKLKTLDDTAQIPKEFKVWAWLKGCYD